LLLDKKNLGEEFQARGKKTDSRSRGGKRRGGDRQKGWSAQCPGESQPSKTDVSKRQAEEGVKQK